MDENMDNKHKEKRIAYVWRNESWIKVGRLLNVKAGDIFYLREYDEEIVTDSKGYKVFVATSNPYIHTYNGIDEDTRYQIYAVPVVIDESSI